MQAHLPMHAAAWPRPVPRCMHAPWARIVGRRRERRVDALRERGPWRRARIPAQRGARSHADRRRAERRRAAARREHGGAVDSRAGGDKGGAAESRAICAADSTAAASRVRPSGAWRGRGAHAAAARTAVRRVARGRGTVGPSCASVSHLRQRDGLRRAVDEATRVPGRARAAVRRRARRRHRRPALARRRSRSRRRPVGQRAHEANLFARAGPEELRVAVLRERCAVRLVRQPFAPCVPRSASGGNIQRGLAGHGLGGLPVRRPPPLGSAPGECAGLTMSAPTSSGCERSTMDCASSAPLVDLFVKPMAAFV